MGIGGAFTEGQSRPRAAGDTFGALLRRYRVAATLSQQALAERAGLSRDAIRALELGRRRAPRLATVTLLAEALHLDAAERIALVAAARGSDPARQASGILEPPVARVSPSLPGVPTPLIGRERELEEITTLLRSERIHLLTLIGPGGVGKTRLALAAAAAMHPAYADGVAFVDLSALRDPTLVLVTVAQALGVSARGGQEADDVLHTYLRARRMLLILDNVEQVAAAAPEIAALLAKCPHLAVLATSRTALHVRMEQRYVVAPLATPGRRPPVETLTSYAAVQLFVARARAVQVDVGSEPASLSTVAEICRRLDGVPLAIELAAAHARLLSPPDLLARLDQRPGVLRGGARDLPPRQQSLRATLDWSFDLLPPQARQLFVALGVFVGGSTVPAIETVGPPCGVDDPLGSLATLVDHHLVYPTTTTRPGGEPRVGLLETIHAYARERLAATDAAEPLRQAHATYYLELAEQDRPPSASAAPRAWLDRIEADLDNMRAALRWARDHSAYAQGLRLAAALTVFWSVRGHLREGRQWLDELLAQAAQSGMALDLLVQARALHGAGTLAYGQGDFACSATQFDESLRLYRILGDQRGLAAALNSLGLVRQVQGDATGAESAFAQSLALSRALDDQRAAALALGNLGMVARDRGDRARARTLYEEALALARAQGDARAIAAQLSNVGMIAREQGDTGQAYALYEESLGVLEGLGDTRGRALVLINLGDLSRDTGAVGQAATRYGEGLQSAQAIGEQWLVAYGLEGLAGVAAARGDVERAARCWGAAAGLRETIGAPLLPVERTAVEREVAETRATLDDTAFAKAWSIGQALPIEQAIAEAMAAAVACV